MGFVILLVMVVYLAMSLGMVAWAIRHAKKNGLSVKKWGWGAALVMYMIPFWDWIPTVAAHQYYCAKDSGFWIYKTLDQWKTENPGVMETLVANDPAPSINQGNADTYYWNQRFISIIKKTGPLLINTWKHEQEIIDSKTGETVGKSIDFSTGNGHVGGELEPRFWIHIDRCLGARDKAIRFVKNVKQFKGANK